jgi:hypothetical protein
VLIRVALDHDILRRLALSHAHLAHTLRGLGLGRAAALDPYPPASLLWLVEALGGVCFDCLDPAATEVLAELIRALVTNSLADALAAPASQLTPARLGLPLRELPARALRAINAVLRHAFLEPPAADHQWETAPPPAGPTRSFLPLSDALAADIAALPLRLPSPVPADGAALIRRWQPPLGPTAPARPAPLFLHPQHARAALAKAPALLVRHRGLHPAAAAVVTVPGPSGAVPLSEAKPPAAPAAPADAAGWRGGGVDSGTVTVAAPAAGQPDKVTLTCANPAVWRPWVHLHAAPHPPQPLVVAHEQQQHLQRQQRANAQQQLQQESYLVPPRRGAPAPPADPPRMTQQAVYHAVTGQLVNAVLRDTNAALELLCDRAEAAVPRDAAGRRIDHEAEAEGLAEQRVLRGRLEDLMTRVGKSREVLGLQKRHAGKWERHAQTVADGMRDSNGNVMKTLSQIPNDDAAEVCDKAIAELERRIRNRGWDTAPAKPFIQRPQPTEPVTAQQPAQQMSMPSASVTSQKPNAVKVEDNPVSFVSEPRHRSATQSLPVNPPRTSFATEDSDSDLEIIEVTQAPRHSTEKASNPPPSQQMKTETDMASQSSRKGIISLMKMESTSMDSPIDLE